jgi:hypothetical protein
MSATATPSRRYDAVLVLLQCSHCRTVTRCPLHEAAKTLTRCCGRVMAFRGHVKPCSCPSCQD